MYIFDRWVARTLHVIQKKAPQITSLALTPQLTPFATEQL